MSYNFKVFMRLLVLCFLLVSNPLIQHDSLTFPSVTQFDIFLDLFLCFGSVEHLLLITDSLLLETTCLFEVILKISVVGIIPLGDSWPPYKTNSE